MKLAVIVTEFPKTTETFILRDLMEFLKAGVNLRIYHLTPWRQDQILHDFAAPLAARARHIPMAGRLAGQAALRHPRLARLLAGQILRHQGRDGRIAAKSLALLGAALQLGEELRVWGADHVHAEFAGHPATAAWIAHHVAAVPYSISCRAHDIFRSQRLLKQKFERAAAIRTISEYGRDFLLQRVAGLGRDRIEVIHSSVDVRAIQPSPVRRGGPFRMLYVGALQPRKGVDVLLNAVAGLDGDWDLQIAGDGPDRAALQSQAQELGLSGRAAFLGQQTFARIEALYHSASVCVAPSVIGPRGRTEGIPNVMIEALAHRRPAISTNVSGIPELIRPGKTGWLTEPGDVIGLRRALEDVMHDPESADRIAARGRAHVEAEFDLQVNARRQLDIFSYGLNAARAKSRAA